LKVDQLKWISIAMKHINQTSGFTFIELLITLAIFSIIVGAIFGFFSSQRDTYLAEELRLERDQNLRTAIEAISRELSAAGYRAANDTFVAHLDLGAPSGYVPSAPIPVTMDANPKITLGEGALPDVITFACSVSTATNPTTLSEDSGGTSVTVSLSNSDSNKQYKPGDVIAVGYLPEYARVAVVDGNVLTIDTDPEASGLQPLQKVYPEGSLLTEISIISYAVFNDDNDPAYERHEAGCPLLKRKINAGGFQPVAENISRMKVTGSEDGVLQVSLTARPNRRHLTGGKVGESTMSTRVYLRNTLQAGFASNCIKADAPAGLVLEEGMDASFPCQVLLSWDPVTVDASGNDLAEAGCPVTGYRIFFDMAEGIFGNYINVSTEDASGYLLDVSGIPSSAIYISVAAQNNGGMGKKTSEAFIADVTPPEKIVGLTAVTAGSNEITLSWDENSECDLAGYYLYRKKDGGAAVLASGMIPAGAGEYTDTGLAPGTSYTYMLEAVDFGFNTGEPSDTVTVLLP
jgi:prepilin-type N-terminal cleavage/methylation domain-containing protein